jgi:hypothetical protein
VQLLLEGLLLHGWQVFRNMRAAASLFDAIIPNVEGSLACHDCDNGDKQTGGGGGVTFADIYSSGIL